MARSFRARMAYAAALPLVPAPREIPHAMCFSATASFVAAAITGGIGLFTLGRVTTRAEAPLAAVPLIFAVQQTIEGSLWLTLDAGPPSGLSDGLTYAFLLLAEVWWPIFVPIAVYFAEPDRLRRRLLAPVIVLGLAVGLFLLWSILTHAHRAQIIDEHMVYASEERFAFPLEAAYFIATVLPPLLSSHRAVRTLGGIVFVGAIVAYLTYWEAFVSVWCFFAAAGSSVILFHFERLRWHRRTTLTR